MADGEKLLTLEDFNGNWDAFVSYLSASLKDAVFSAAKAHGISPQQASDAMLAGSVRYARRLHRDRLANSN